MIKYSTGSFGFAILFRLHGSAVFKSVFPAFISSALFLILYFFADIYGERWSVLIHPYPVTALIAALTFLLSFRGKAEWMRLFRGLVPSTKS